MKESRITVAMLWSQYMGDGTSVNELALRLNPGRFRVITLSLTKKSPGPKDADRESHNVIYVSEKQKLRAFSLTICWKLLKILSAEKVDILHCHRHKASFYGTLAGIFAGTPVIFSHVHGLGRTRNARRKLLNFFMFKKVTRVIGCAKSVRDDVLKNNPSVSSDKVIALENSVDFERFANVSLTKVQAKSNLGVIPPDAFVYGTIARFAPNKGHIYLIRAFEKVKERVPSAHLILVGEGRLQEILEAEAARTTACQSIHFLGRRADIPKVLRAMDVLVLSSIGSEGMPLVILEAMSAGVPCIASLLSGIPEVINSREVGYLVPPKDENALVEAMVEVATMPEQELIKVSDNARTRVRHCYAHEVLVKKLERLYQTEILSCKVR
ncbi:MAG: glycosyltransferase [Planctomycetota bacterium]